MPQEKKQQPFSMYLEEKCKNKAITDAAVSKWYQQWKMLSEKQQNKYKAKADAVNRKYGKLDSFGNSVKEREEAEQDEISAENDMKKRIAEFVRMLGEKKALEEEIFTVICINYYVFLSESGYIPAEVGICQFSVKEGIVKSYCKILPASLPHGAAYEAKQHSQSTHKIPLKLPASLRGDRSKFEEEIFKIFSNKVTGLETVYLYTQRSFVEAVESIMKQFNLPLDIKIFPLDVLVQNLYSVFVEEIKESQATSILKNSNFEFKADISCVWHQGDGQEGVNHCALNYVHRWVYNIFESIDIKKIFGADPVEGKHMPHPDSPLFSQIRKLKVDKKSKKKGKRNKHTDRSPSVDDTEQSSSQKSQDDNEYGANLFFPSNPRTTFDTNSEEDFPPLGF